MIETDFNWYHKKFKEYTLFVERSEWFGWSLIFYWVFIMSVVYIFNIIKGFLGLKFLSRYNNLINKTLLIPSEFKNYHDKTFILWKIIPFNFPTRANAIFVTLFFIIIVISFCVEYNVTLPHPLLESRL